MVRQHQTRNLEVPGSMLRIAPERRDRTTEIHKEDPMNIRSNPDTTRPAVTTGPLPASRKIFVTP